MKIAFNPSTVAALITPPNNKDITFDLRGRNIFARGVKFQGTDTWRDIKINNVSIGSNILDLRNGSNTTLTNTNGVVTINSTWRPVVDNLTSDSTTSSLSANQGRVLKSLIDGKSNSGHTHDDRYLKLTGGTMTGIIRATNRGGTWISGRDHCLIRSDDKTSSSYWSAILAIATVNGYWTLGHLGDGGERIGFNYDTDVDYNAGRNNNHVIWLPTGGAEGTLALTSDIPTSLKNPYALTISLNGTSQGPYDGSAAKSINITPGSIGAATSGHNHDSSYVKYTKVTKSTADNANATPYLYNVENEEVISGYYKYWYIFNMGQYSGGNFGTQIAMPYQDSLTDSELFIRSAKSGSWRTWRRILHSNNYAAILDSRYYTKSEVNTKLGTYLSLSGGTVTGNIILKGGTSADMTYAGNVHPYIRFDNSDSSQNVSLIFTDYDTYRRPAGIKLVGNQGNEWFEAANIYATTFYGTLSGNATTAITLQTTRTLWGQSFNGSANVSGNMSGVGQITFSALSGTNGRALLYQKMADNDYFRIYAGGTGNNGGYAEIATADDGNEPIYVRQYTGVFSTIKRTLTLLDGSGNTIFPGSLSIGGNIIFPNSSHLLWNSGSWYQRILLTDDSTADTAVFTLQQSSDSGTNWSNLITIRDNGKIIANTFVGDLQGNASTTSKWTTARTLSLTGSITGSVSFDGSGNITLNTTYGTGNITNLDSRYLKRTGDTMSGTLSFSPTDSSDAAPKIYSTVSSGLTSLNFEVADDENDRFVFRINYWNNTNTTNRERFTIDWNNVISKAPITAPSFNGNATSATKLQTTRQINGTNFDGSANITTSYWGTTRTLTIGNSGKSVNGSANISWSLSEIGAASSDHNHDNRYVRKWTGVYGSANKFLKLAISNEKGWIRLEVSDSNNALSGGYGIYIIGWGWHDSNSTDTLFARCLYANDSRYTTALKIVRTSRNNYDFYFQFASDSSYPSYTINYSSSVSSIDCTVTAIDTIPTATWTSSLSALQLNASQVDWSGITNKPSAFNPAAHTHTVFNNNLMIKGTNGVSDSASIHLGIGDSDTGFKWISDGKCQIYANNVAVGEWTSGGMNWFKNPTVNGNKVWNAGNDGSDSGLDADTVDGAHLSDIKNWSDRTASVYWKAGWYKVASAQTATNTEAFLTLDVNAARSNGHATLFIRKRADSKPYFICIHNNNLNLADFRLYYNGMSMALYARVPNDWNGRVFRIISEGREGEYYHIWTLYSNISSTDPNAISAEGGNPYINPTYSGRVDWSNSSDKATRLQTSRTLWGQSFDGTNNVTGLITLSSGSHVGIKISNTYIDAIDQALIIHNNSGGIRFGNDAWDWTQWAGLKYVHGSRLICLGIAEGTDFTANSNLDNGTLRLSGITTLQFHAAEAHIGHSRGYSDPWGGLDANFKFGGILAATHIYSNGGFHKNGSNNSYVLLGGGGHKALSDFSMSHSHPYLPLSGGTMTGVITSTYASNTWINGVTNAVIKGTYTGYGAILSMPVKTGRVSLSSYPANDNNIYFGYATTAQINAGTNSFNKQMYWDAANNNLHAAAFTGHLYGTADNAVNSDTVDGYHANGLLTTLSNTNNGVSITVGGTTKSVSNISVNYASSAGNADTVDGEHASAFTRIVGRNSIGTSGTAPYNYIHLFRIANSSGYSTVDCEIDFRTRYHSAKLEIRISTAQYPYNSGGSSISIVKKIISGRTCKFWVLPTIQSSKYNYYDVYYESGAWNSGSYGIIFKGSNGGLVFEHKGTNLASLPDKVVPVTDDVAASATKVIVNQHTANDTNYPLVWSNQNNSNTVTENQLFKSWSDLYYNPKNKRLTVGGSIYAAHFYESSDKTLKKNIKSILSSTNIPKIREFDWKDTGEHSYGFIAQELEEQGYGCLVSEANGKKTVNYTATLALTVAKLQNLINIQNKKISNLTKELKALKYGRKKNS